MRLRFWNKPIKVVGANFSYTLPKGSWHLSETTQINAKGDSHTVVILTPTPVNKLERK